MLLPYALFISLPADATRVIWFAVDLVVAIWVLRRLRLPAYWLAFPPLFGAITLGHVEVLVLLLLVLPGALGGLAVAIKPYAAFPLLAERRWSAFVVAIVFVLVTLPFLPWGQFISEFGMISATVVRQSYGDSVFGQPLLMAIGVVALASLGARRGLWLAVPVLWPYAQPLYKTMTLPALTPLVTLAWVIPIPGATLAGVVAQAALERLDARRPLPPWLRYGIQQVAVPLRAKAVGRVAQMTAAVPVAS